MEIETYGDQRPPHSIKKKLLVEFEKKKIHSEKLKCKTNSKI